MVGAHETGHQKNRRHFDGDQIRAEEAVRDFFDVDPERLPAFDAVVGNPPFIRYQSFSGAGRAKALARAREQGVALETAILAGNSEVVVPQEVASRGIDLIVLGGFDSSKVRFELLFRQRQQIADHAPCPVLIAR